MSIAPGMAATTTAPAASSRTAWFGAANVGFFFLLVVGSLRGDADPGALAYLMLLFLLCSLPILVVRRMNDRFALLALFSMVYFMFYGQVELIALLAGEPSPAITRSGFGMPEIVILAGGILAHVSYRLACREEKGTTAGVRRARDWPERSLVVAGLAMWVITTWLTWQFKVHVVVDSDLVNQKKGLASVGAGRAAMFMLATYLQPLSILIVAYAQSRYRRRYLIPVLVAHVFVQMVMGFVVDIKGDALIGLVIVLLTKALVDGRVPTRWLVVGAVVVAIAWPVMQANRAVRNDYSLDHTQAAKNILKTLELAVSMKSTTSKGPERADTLFERTSLKGSVELIVNRTGHGVAFRDGYTLEPMLTAFVPRLIWPNKPDIQAGLLMNKDFQIVADDNVYISPSHLGELYWNFGWPGVLIGMSLIGALLGHLGGRLDLSRQPTLTRVMLVVLTAKLLVLGAESSIAPQYVIWMRSLLAVAGLHLLFARPVTMDRAATDAGSLAPAPPRRLPNLMT